MQPTHEMTRRERVLTRRYLKIDPTSPSGLRWKNGGLSLRNGGHPAGERHKNSYWRVTVEGRLIRAHNLVYWLAHGIDPAVCWPFTVDHIDRNGFNNDVNNLRLASKREQNLNREPCRSTNHPVGAAGFRWVSVERSGRFRGQFCRNNRPVYVGTYDTPEEAYQAVLDKRQELGL